MPFLHGHFDGISASSATRHVEDPPLSVRYRDDPARRQIVVAVGLVTDRSESASTKHSVCHVMSSQVGRNAARSRRSGAVRPFILR